MGVEMLTDLQAGDVRGYGLVASLVRVRVSIIFEIFTEGSVRDRFFHGGVSAVLTEGHLYGDQRRSAVDQANADVILHILVGNSISVQNIAVAIGLKHLDGSVEGEVYNGAAESLLAIEIGISDLALVLIVHLCELQGIKTLVENASEGLGIGLAILGSSKALVLIQHAAFKRHDVHALVSFRRHRNTSFFCDASILPYFATFFKKLFVNSGRRNLSFKDFGQRGTLKKL